MFPGTRALSRRTRSIESTAWNFRVWLVFAASALGGPGSVTVTTAAGCTWTAVSQDLWIVITSGASGTGNGTVEYTVAPNNTNVARSGTITIAGLTYTQDQSK